MVIDDDFDDADLDKIVAELDEEEELGFKAECQRCGSKIWEAARFKKGKVIKCTDCPSDFDVH